MTTLYPQVTSTDSPSPPPPTTPPPFRTSSSSSFASFPGSLASPATLAQPSASNSNSSRRSRKRSHVVSPLSQQRDSICQDFTQSSILITPAFTGPRSYSTHLRQASETSSAYSCSSSSSTSSVSSSSSHRSEIAAAWRAYPIRAVCETDDLTTASHSQSRSHGKDTRGPLVVAGDTSDAGGKTQRKDKQQMDYVIRSGIAGGVAGCVAKTAIAPLDRVKILFQAQNPEFQKYAGHWLGVFRAGREIAAESGVAGLFRGHSATLMRIFPYAAIKYMAYDKLHFVLMPTRASETSSRLFLAGATSGVLSVFLTYPLELIRVRLAFETKRRKVERGSVRRIIRQIYTEGATEAPFSGDARKRAATATATAAAAASKTISGRSNANGSGSNAAGIAGTSNGNSSSLSSSVAQNRALAQGVTAFTPVPPSAPTTSVETANTLLQRFPMMKFYRGFSVTVLGMIPYAGTSFLVFGRCKSLLQNFFGVVASGNDNTDGLDGGNGGGRYSPSKVYTQWRPSKTTIDLASGALAGAISQTAAYPFEVVRRRQQVAAVIRPGTMVGFQETVTWIWKTSGWKGFYTGLSIGFLKVVPMTSISFAVWLGMKRQMDI